MESGKLKVENGKSKIESGKWKIESGKLKMESGKEGAYNFLPLLVLARMKEDSLKVIKYCRA
jgi:hypothetical protein